MFVLWGVRRCVTVNIIFCLTWILRLGRFKLKTLRIRELICVIFSSYHSGGGFNAILYDLYIWALCDIKIKEILLTSHFYSKLRIVYEIKNRQSVCNWIRSYFYTFLCCEIVYDKMKTIQSWFKINVSMENIKNRYRHVPT